MRVFQLNTFCGIKSTGRIATDIALTIESDGGECLIGYGAGDVPEEYARFAFRVGGPAERKLHGAMRKLLDMEGYGSRAATMALIRKITDFRPDVIHLHNIHGCYLNLPALFEYISGAGVPVIWTLHDCWSFTGHCAYFDFCGCMKWKTGCDNCEQLRSYPVCYGIDGSERNYRLKKLLFTSVPRMTLVTPCKWLAGKLKESYLKDLPVRVIYNGVDRGTFRPQESDLRERYGLGDRPVVLSVASEWDARKGLRYALECAERLGDRYAFVIIGLSQEQISALPSYVLGLSHTASTGELREWYSLAGVLLNPTLEDNMPLVNLEALACGTPVAVFDTGGCGEAIDSGCGRVVQKGDAGALIRAVSELAKAKSEMSAACLKRAEDFDKTACYRRYLTLYGEAVV